MNKWIGIGRLSKAIEVRHTAGENSMAVGRTSIAVDRRGNKGEVDFINLVAFGKTAEAIEKYSDKGKKIAVEGHIQTGSYTNKDGQKVYTTDIVVDNVEFVEWKDKTDTPAPSNPADGFMTVPEGIDEDLPFNRP
jgi:single-strand DNA-binding protein